MAAKLAPQALQSIYERAVYEVDFDEGTTFIRPGRTPEGPMPSRQLAIITAWNPGSRRPSPRENHEANRKLAAEIVRRGWSFWPARGRDEEGTHVEESFAVAGIAADASIALGRLFHQAAVFYWDGRGACILACQD